MDARAVVALLARDVDQRAVGAVSPGVVWAAKSPAGIAGEVADQLGAFVRAPVHEKPDAAVGMADANHRLGRNIQRDEVARLAHLARVADVDPGARPQALHLELEDLRVRVDVAVDPIGLYQALERSAIVPVAVHGRIV